ncbi:hypothetical protein DB347_20800 [Opitutaceae bacterium EW11]|nr:hypothetical protein DB347_20800 [Opitutaceae bacterium EW11]
MFVVAAVLAVVAIVFFQYWLLYVVVSVASASLAAQAVGLYCGIYACNKKCTYGVISLSTHYFVRLDSTPKTQGATDIVANGVSLVSRLDLQRFGAAPSGVALGSRHYRGPVATKDGRQVQLLLKGTAVDLGAPALQPSSEEATQGDEMRDAHRMQLMVTPPSVPSDLGPGGIFGIEKRN